VRLLFALGGATTAALLPFFVLWLRDRGLTADRIGIVLAVSNLAGVLTAPAWGHVADTRLGSVGALRVASVGAALTALALVPTGSVFALILLVSAVHATMESPGTALADAIALGHLGVDRATSYGSIRLWASAGWAVAVIAFGALFQRRGLGAVMPIYAGGMLLYALVLTARFQRIRPEGRGSHGTLVASWGALRSNRRLLIFLAGLLVVSTATWGTWSFVPLRIASRGGGAFLVGLAAGLAAVVEIPFFRASAWLGRVAGQRLLYAAGCGIYIAMMVGWALVPAPGVVAAIKVVGGAGFGLTYAALVVITGRLVPRELQATGQTLMQVTGNWIGPILGSAAGGFVYRHVGPPALFGGAAALLSVGVVVVWSSLRGVDERGPAAAVR
jgi:PPP family 3-phenylpropionic acid transporter